MLNISKKTILLADNDIDYMEKVKQMLEGNISVQVIGMVNNGEKALKEAEEKRPDMILMDILLGEKDGLWVLEELNKRKISSTCVILSAIGTDNVVRQAMDLGAMYYMTKPIEFTVLLERIVQVFTAKKEMALIKERVNLSQKYYQKGIDKKYEDQKRNELKNMISRLLNRMGITASIKGYHFIRSGVVMVVENKEAILSVTKGLYPDIAKEYNTTAEKVERAIRHAIETAWKRAGKEIFYELAGYYIISKPTNSQFIAVMSEYFRTQS